MHTPSRSAKHLWGLVRPKFTQTELAKACGVSQPAVASWIDSISKPGPKHRECIERMTGVSARGWDEDFVAEQDPHTCGVVEGRQEASREFVAMVRSRAASSKSRSDSLLLDGLADEIAEIYGVA